MEIESLRRYWRDNFAENIKDLEKFLTFASISTDPEFATECSDCAQWLQKYCEAIGMSASLLETSGKPVVFAEFRAPPDAPVVLIYAHYDVQPPGDPELWKSPPFVPEIRDNRIYARGAVDNKGQLFFLLKAIQLLIATGNMRCSLKLLVEGEEESGSEGLTESLTKWGPMLRSDVLMVCDTGMPGGTPTIMIGLRGIAGLTIELRGPSRELHSGYHGNLALNPALELCRMLSTLHAADRSIAVQGFYDGVPDFPEKLKDLINRQSFDPVNYEKETGCPPNGGEKLFPVAERVGLRASIDINGLASGYAGPGSKTIVPESARVTLTTRLVAGQDPARCVDLIEKHLRDRLPAGLRMQVLYKHSGGRAMLVSPDHTALDLCSDVLEEVFGTEPVYRCHGASIPIVAELAEISGAAPVVSGFSLESDHLHAIDESFGLDRLENGFVYAAVYLGRLAAIMSAAKK